MGNQVRQAKPERCDDLPRVGAAFTMPGAFDRVEWYGRGPHESYPDRARGAALGRYVSSVAEQMNMSQPGVSNALAKLRQTLLMPLEGGEGVEGGHAVVAADHGREG